MLRVLMTTTGHPGHFLPLVPFGRAFVRAGHDVRVAAPESHEPSVRQAGLELAPCTDLPGEQVERILASAAERTTDEGHAFMMRDAFGSFMTRTVLPDVRRIVRTWRPDVVVREAQEYTGCLVAELEGIPHVRVSLGLGATEEETLSTAAPALDELRAELGLPSDPDAERLRESPYLTLIPEALERPGLDRPGLTYRFRSTPRAPEPLPDWWPGESGPLVYLTFGSVAGILGYFPGLYRTAVEALAGIRARILITTGEDFDPAELGPLPRHIHAQRWVPQEAVVPHAAAVVCHGGHGSVLGGLAYGLPMVMLPLFARDQWHNARRVAEIGAGIALEERPSGRRMFGAPSADVFAALPGALERVLGEPAYRRAAGDVAEAIDALPPVEAAAGVLGAIAGERKALESYSG